MVLLRPGWCCEPARAIGEGGAVATAAAMQGATPAYVPGPVEVGWEIYVGAAACVAVFALGAWEFVKRIVRYQIFAYRRHHA